MPVYCCRIELHVPASGSLKDKRQVLRSIMDRMRSGCHVSVSECDYQNSWQRTSLLVAFAASDHAGMKNRADSLRRIVEDNDEVEILAWSEEICAP